jgi:16S rRNA (uracil1498-N3)-methyltransferase
MRRFFLDSRNVHSDRATITGPDVRHIRTVLRLKPGDEILLFDGEGFEYRARIVGSTSETISLLILDQYPSISESPVEITWGQALLKARKMDCIVRQLTELGTYAFIPFLAERSVPKADPGRLAERVDRWQTIAKEALKQCGRTRPPHIGPVASFKKLVTAPKHYDLKIILHDHPSAPEFQSFSGRARDVGKVLALVGPEGGFTDEEVKLAINCSFNCISLGPRILKSDTAAVAAAAILQYTFGDLGGAQKGLDKGWGF